MNILITGDSFAADWTIKYPNQIGWPNLLAETFNVTNLAQAGCSEYRIYKQLLSVDLKQFDLIIISHTSPYRIYTDYNPQRQYDSLHHHCDLLFSDVEELASSAADYQIATEFFKKFFSLEYADFTYKLTVDAIIKLLADTKSIHLTNLVPLTIPCLDFSKLFSTHRGLINHYNDIGNRIIYDKIIQEIQK
jgi:hypothetical protein